MALRAAELLRAHGGGAHGAAIGAHGAGALYELVVVEPREGAGDDGVRVEVLLEPVLLRADAALVEEARDPRLAGEALVQLPS
eukprot:4515931-Pyramimonas_sp.AAC.1